MDKARLIRGFVVVLAGAFVVIAAAQLLQGHPLGDAVPDALLWSTISSAIFTAGRIYRWRKGQYCAMCGDAPAAASADREGKR
jgi:hypothetical protein